jgi:hypothetical protein
VNSLPTNTLSTESVGDWLDNLLRETSAAPIADDGFSARVMQRLPVAMTAAQVREVLERRTRQSQRYARFSLVGAVLGSVIAFWGSTWPSADEMVVAVQALMALKPVAAQVATPWLASLCTAVVLAYALARED